LGKGESRKFFDLWLDRPNHVEMIYVFALVAQADIKHPAVVQGESGV
jgi:hypothetical protein